MKYLNNLNTLSFFLLMNLGFISMGCTDAPVGSESRPFTMYFVPSVDSETLTTSAKSIADFVQPYVSRKLYGKETGFYIKTAIPTSYIAVVEAFGTKKADFAALTTFSYILAKDIKKYDLEAVLAPLRGKDGLFYKSQIIARANSGIKSIKDLNGKSFAFVDPASTTGFILPSKLFKDNGIKIGESVFAQKHDNVVTMVYQNQVDAGATYYNSPKEVAEESGKKVLKIQDARARVLKQFPDVEKKVIVIGYSEPVTNEPWVMRTQLLKDPIKNKELTDAIIEACLEFSKTEEGKKMIESLATGTGIERVTDKDYESVRKMIQDFSVDIEKILQKKG